MSFEPVHLGGSRRCHIVEAQPHMRRLQQVELHPPRPRATLVHDLAGISRIKVRAKALHSYMKCLQRPSQGWVKQ